MSIDSRRFQTTPTRKGDVVPSAGNFTKKGTTENYPTHEGIVRRMEPSHNTKPSGRIAGVNRSAVPMSPPSGKAPAGTGRNKRVPQADLASAARRKLGM